MTTSDLDPHRLPRTVLPRRYDIRLEPSLDEARFRGTVDITVEAAAGAELVVMNAADLVIGGVGIDGEPATWELWEETERLAVTPSAPLAPGTHRVTVAFEGVLNDHLRGFYRSTFIDADGRERTIATTQMQSTDCRRAFPCFDEPDLKAVFGVTLVVDEHLLALSNGPEVSRHPLADGRVEVRFADTMPMSTYIVAFVVGPLEVTPPVDVDGVPVRLVHLPGKAHLTTFALDIAAGALRWLTAYYGIPYPDQKIDLVAIPDFAAGAMENTGLITFRETLLLIDPATATLPEQMNVADVVAHELAHMWFGNLVTMRWWNGIWLNEAFATFMEVAVVDHLKPEWRRWELFATERTAAFDTDSLSSTRPIEYPVLTPADCEGMFDVLTYQKGGSILRMLEQHLGEERFRDGVRRYLSAHRFGNTETGDLWDAIEASVAAAGGDDPVRALMDSWIWQPGYPLVTARLDGRHVVLTQRRFAFEPDAEDATTWLVPVAVRIGDDTRTVLLRDEPITLELTSADAPVVVNAGGHGFFRVDLDPELLARLDGPVLRTLLPLERYGLVDDAWNATVAGRLGAAELLSFLAGFADEDDLAVWQAIATGLVGLARLVEGEPLAALRSRIAAIVRPTLDRMGWEPASGESERDGRLRGLLVTVLAVHAADPDALSRCRDLLDAAEADPAAVHPDLVAASLTAVASAGDAGTYERLLRSYETATTPQEQIRYLYALAELPDADLLRRTCELAFSGKVRTQNAPFLLALCIANREHGSIAWSVVREHWDAANRDFPSNTIVRMVSSVRHLNTPEMLADVQGFFREHAIPQAGKILDQVLERQRVNVALRERESTPLARALSDAP